MSYSNFSISQRMNSRNFNVFSPMLGQGGCSILQVLPTWDANEKPPVAKWETSTHNCRYRAYLRRFLNVFWPKKKRFSTQDFSVHSQMTHRPYQQGISATKTFYSCCCSHHDSRSNSHLFARLMTFSLSKNPCKIPSILRHNSRSDCQDCYYHANKTRTKLTLLPISTHEEDSDNSSEN
jgi:hypothetical protein